VIGMATCASTERARGAMETIASQLEIDWSMAAAIGRLQIQKFGMASDRAEKRGRGAPRRVHARRAAAPAALRLRHRTRARDPRVARPADSGDTSATGLSQTTSWHEKSRARHAVKTLDRERLGRSV